MDIEQVLMRAIKSSGSLIYRRGISPSAIATWVHSMPASSRIADEVEEFIGICPPPQNSIWTCESLVSIARPKMSNTSQTGSRNIIHSREHLLSLHLSTGMLDDENINCDTSLQVVVTEIKPIEGMKSLEIHLKPKLVGVSLCSVTQLVTVRNKLLRINPNHLFHRIVCTMNTEEQLSENITFELSAYLIFLFDEGLMRKDTKTSIVRLLSTTPTQLTANSASTQSVPYVVDDGHLLHLVIRQYLAPLKEIFQKYTAYVTTHYGQAHLVLDWYGGGQSTKYEEHLYRSRKACYVDVAVENYLYENTIAKERVRAQFNLAILPSTSAAAREHSLRVLHQVQEWRGVDIDPLSLGWKVLNVCLRPIPSSKNATP
ncbi:hypothetical protein PR048_009848 [Dryococelus australis]|uniref:Uncharacterized protein n=1 Tax=Dryococelus australis TaxID=614101 RepID=A0ABQ9I131_9NEOP|nr:hypothetical protein PR048_009848 [Dryococelus australis]